MVLRAGSSVVSYDAIASADPNPNGSSTIKAFVFCVRFGSADDTKRKIVSLEFVLCVLTFGVLRLVLRGRKMLLRRSALT